VSGVHIDSKALKFGRRWYVDAWRGGPCIHQAEGAKPVIRPELLAKAVNAQTESRGLPADTFEQLLGDYRNSPEFDHLAKSTKRDYRLWLAR